MVQHAQLAANRFARLLLAFAPHAAQIAPTDPNLTRCTQRRLEMRPESDVPMHERMLIVEGRASLAVLAQVGAGLPEEKPSNCEVLFISFAYADIPIGRTFSIVFPTRAPQSALRIKCEILAVTQQFAKPFDEIPHGWKTICLMKFDDGIPDIVATLPTVNGWYENRDTVSLCDEDTWRLNVA